MKPTKHLKAIAEDMTNDDMKRFSWMTEEQRHHYYAKNLSQLTDLRQALLDGRQYFRVNRVSQSGMSRVIEIAYIKDNELYKVQEPSLLKLAGCSKDGRISGCGMDMLFH